MIALNFDTITSAITLLASMIFLFEIMRQSGMWSFWSESNEEEK